ncbi:hypothetical protein D3C87_2045060 [compost metagenome]
MLNEDTHICPNCGKKQNQTQLFIILGIFVFFIILGFIASNGQQMIDDTIERSKIFNILEYKKENFGKINKEMEVEQV